MPRRAGRAIRKIVIGLVIFVACLAATFAIPVRTWRTGEQPVPPLSFVPKGSIPTPPTRIWIDTDAACGHSPRTDPDDCFAIVLLARMPAIDIVGISTVFGNASLEVTESVTRSLVGVLDDQYPPVYRGSAEPLQLDRVARTAPAHEALRTAATSGPLTILALGPLTNIAVALHDRPHLQQNVARLVTVMGRRIGHLFHPAEGVDGGILFGHGPVFRDFNVAMDVEAAARVVTMNVPMTLIPYEVGRDIEITSADLDRLAVVGGPQAWVSKRARGWLQYWLEDVGRAGFYPFDLMAAAFVIDPNQFRCAQVHAWVGEDRTLLLPFLRPTGLMVSQDPSKITEPRAVGSALYCPAADIGSKAQFLRWLLQPRHLLSSLLR